MASLDATPEPEGFDLKVEVPGGAISTLASTCASNFHNTLQRLGEGKDKKYESTLRKFEKRFLDWAAYLGVFAGGDTSLDHRLERHPQYRDLVLLVLDMLNVSLAQTTTEPSEPSSDESSDDGVDRWKIEAESIQRSISELDRLAIHIRQSSTSSLDARVKAFGARKPSEVSSYETRATIAVSCLYPGASDSLRRYLSKSITQRHTKLLYWQSHDKKLRADRRRDKQRRDDSIQTPREPSPLPTKAPPLPRQSARDEDPAPPTPGESRFSAGSSFLSGTRASELGSQFTIPPAEAKISTRKRAGASTALRTGAKFPSPPKFEDGELQKPCPLCRKIFLKDDFIDNTWWRSHVNDDLVPFVCVSSTCMGSPTFASRTAWKGHTKQCHDGMWLQSLEVDSQNSSDTVNAMVTCPLCCLPLAEFTNLKPSILQASESETSPPKTRTPSGNKRVSKTVRFDISEPKTLATADRKTATQAESSMMLDHIADHLQFLALMTPRLSTEKLAEGDTHTFSSDQVLSTDQGSGKRSTLDDDFSFVADEAQDADMDEPLDEAPQTDAILDQAWREDEEIELVEAMDWSIVATLNPSNEGDDKIEHMQRVRAECDNLLEAALESSVEGRHFRHLFLETAAASCKSITAEMLLSLESEIAVGAFIDFFAREIPRDALHSFLEKALTSIGSRKDSMLIDYCTEQVWDFRPYQDPHTSTEEMFASRRVLFGLLALLDRPLDTLRAIKDGISDLSIPLAKSTLTQLFPTWTGTEVSSFMRLQRDVQTKLESTPHPFASIPFRRDPMFVDRRDIRELQAQPIFLVPFPNNPFFVGRGDILIQLQSLLFESNSRKVALVGLGGIGKTQIALQLAYWTKEKKQNYSVFWVPALSHDSFEQACVQIMNACGISTTNSNNAVESVCQYLSSKDAGNWLLVVDNADDMQTVMGSVGAESGIYRSLPQSDQGRILFTTRHRKVAISVAGRSILDIPTIGRDEARSYFKQALSQEVSSSDDRVMNHLLMLLEYLPLAMVQAAAYLNENEISLMEYLQLFENKDRDRIELLSAKFQDNTRYKQSQEPVATTWFISFNQIRRADELASRILMFLAYVEPKGVPQSMLPEGESQHQLTRAIGTLCGYKFLDRRGSSQVFDMHSLVHIATRSWIMENDSEKEQSDAAIARLREVFPTDDWENRDIWRQYLPHAIKLLRCANSEWSEELCKLGFWVGRCLLVDGHVIEAVKLLEHVVKVHKTILAENHPDRLASQHALARAYEANGQTAEAVELLEHVVTVRETTLAENHPDRLASQHELARAYQSNGQIAEAVKLLEHVVIVRETTLAENHPDRLASQHELARSYQSNGQIEEAVKLLEHVVTVRETTLAENHLSRLASQHELARAYQSNGQIEEAVKLLEHVVAVRETISAENHPDRLASQHELARSYQSNGQIEEAVKLLEHVVTVRETTLAENHPSRLASQHELARSYQSNGQIEEAVKLLEHVVTVRETTLAENHLSRLASQHELARLYQANGQIAEAVKLLEHVVAVEETTLAENHLDRLASQYALAGAYQANGQIAEAVKLLEHVVAVEETTLAENHLSRLASQHALAGAYQANGQIAEAVKLLEHVVAVEETTLAENHLSRLASQYALAGAYQANGQIAEAVKLLEHVVAVEETTLAENHLSRLASQHALAGAYQANGQIAEAVKLLEHVVAVEETTLAENHPSRLASQHALAGAYKVNVTAQDQTCLP